MSRLLDDLDSGIEVKTKYGICYAYSPDVVEEVKHSLQRLDFLDDANDLPTNCHSIFKNRCGDEVVIMRKEEYERLENYKEDVESELNYASKCHNLEEQLGFSLEKLNETTHIYATDYKNVLRKYEIIGVNFKEKKIWFLDTFSPMYLEFEYYKKSFWLKEDKSE